MINYHFVKAVNPLSYNTCRSCNTSCMHYMHATHTRNMLMHATSTCMHHITAGTCLQHGNAPRGNTSRITCRKVSIMAGPWVVRMCLDRPCRDMLRKASRVRGRFSAMRLTCLRPRKAFLGEMIAMVCSKAFMTMARWHCSSCNRCGCQGQHSRGQQCMGINAWDSIAWDSIAWDSTCWLSDAGV